MKRIALFIVIILIGSNSFSQEKGDRNKRDFEKFKAQKISYMTDKMELTPKEAQAFWPIYNEFDEKRWALHERRRNIEKKIRDNYQDLKDTDFQKINQEMVNIAKNEAKLMEEYNAQFIKALPVKKVILIAPVENDFRFMMIKAYREKKQNNQNPPQD